MLLSALPSLALEQTPEGGQEYKGQSQGRGGGKASTITEVILAAGSSGCVLGVAVVHSLKAAGHTGLAHLHPGRGVVCRGGKAGQDPERGQPKHAGPLGQDPLCLGLPERILEQVEPPSSASPILPSAPPRCSPERAGAASQELTSARRHAVGDHGRAAHGVEAVLPIVGAHMAVQSLSCGRGGAAGRGGQRTGRSAPRSHHLPQEELEGEVVTGISATIPPAQPG